MSINSGCHFQRGEVVICKRRDVLAAGEDGKFHSSAADGGHGDSDIPSSGL